MTRPRIVVLFVMGVLLLHPQYSMALSIPDSLRLNYRYNVDLNEIPYRHESLISKSWPAVVLFSAGVFYTDYKIDTHIQHLGSMTSTEFDIANWAQYAPAAIMLGTLGGLKLLGVKEYSDWPQLITMGAIASATEAILVNGLKYTIKRERPDQQANNSFPSGHTATSFMTATMLHRELGQTISPWFSVGGFALATLVGISRNASNRHWISDVAAGAGIGIFSTEFAYTMTDLIFKEKHITNVDSRGSDYPLWRFGIDTHYYFDAIKRYHGDEIPEELMPGYSIGMVGQRQISDYLSLKLSTDITRIRWKGSEDIVLPVKGDLPALFSAKAGLACGFQPARNLKLQVDMLAGMTHGHDYELQDLDGNSFTAEYPRNSFSSSCHLETTIRTSRYSSVSGYLGLEHYHDYALMAVAGTSINIIF